jgi:hypothetical protein
MAQGGGREIAGGLSRIARSEENALILSGWACFFVRRGFIAGALGGAVV